MLTRSLPIILPALAAGLAIGLRGANGGHSTTNVLLIVVPLSMVVAIVAAGLGLWRTSERQRRLYESYRLTIDEGCITREQFDTVSIRKSDIAFIAKNANRSFTIRGRSSREIIGIAAQIEDYDELERHLQQMKPVGGTARKPLLEKYQGLAVIVTIILLAAVFLSNNKAIVTPSAVLLLGLLGWSFLETKRSKQIDARTKRGMLFMIFPCIGIVAKVVFLWL